MRNNDDQQQGNMDIEHVSFRHDIDLPNRLIITTWSGRASDDDFIRALTSYQEVIKGHRDYQLFNELLDFRHITKLNLSTRGIIDAWQNCAAHRSICRPDKTCYRGQLNSGHSEWHKCIPPIET